MLIPKEMLPIVYQKMRAIRETELALKQAFAEGKIPGFVHLYIGEEAIASGVCTNLNKEDYIVSTHRGHGHFIAKDAPLYKLIAEVMGKETGFCMGKGGSMHMTDVENGLYGTTGIVGGGFPAAVGLALAAKKKKNGKVSVCFFGDGAVNEGTFHESLNLAAIWDLPVIFVCENNLYAQSTPQEYHQKVKDIALRAEGYGIPGVIADGMDVFSVYNAAKTAIGRARKGEGPTLIEAKSYLFGGHYEGDAMAYRYPDEMEYYRTKRDCLELFRKKVLESGMMKSEELERIDSIIKEEVANALEYAERSPYPEPSQLFENVYVHYS